MPSAAAPGFVYLAGSCRGLPVGGGGADAAEAAAAIARETAEVLAQTADPVACDLPGDPALDAPWTSRPAPVRIAGRRLPGGAPLGVPAASVFLRGPAAAERRADAPPASLGIAAGPDPAAASLAALLMLVERDAAARWWSGATRPRQLDARAAAGAGMILAGLRAGASLPRATAFLALPAAADIPVVCALSRDPEGRGLAVGIRADLDASAAASAAGLDLLRMELALEMARHRAAGPGAAASDRGPLERAALDTDTLPAFQVLPPRISAPAPGRDAEALAAALDAAGIALACVDLPAAPGGLAVAKVLAAGLRPLPGDRTPPEPVAAAALAPLM